MHCRVGALQKVFTLNVEKELTGVVERSDKEVAKVVLEGIRVTEKVGGERRRKRRK